MGSIRQNRQDNLIKLINEYNTIADLAEAIDRAPSVVSQLKNGRAFGEKMARHIEASLGLADGCMDKPPSRETLGHIDELLDMIKTTFERQQTTLEEKRILAAYRKLPNKKKILALSIIQEMAEKDSLSCGKPTRQD